MKTVVRLAVMSLVGLVLFGALVFVPAGTVHYWQGWVFLAVFAVSTWIPSLYLGLSFVPFLCLICAFWQTTIKIPSS